MDAAYVGRIVKCPHCGTRMEVPAVRSVEPSMRHPTHAPAPTTPHGRHKAEALAALKAAARSLQVGSSPAVVHRAMYLTSSASKHRGQPVPVAKPTSAMLHKPVADSHN